MSATTGRTLLGVWAHPDDEAYLSAGLMLEYTARGDRVVIVTATLGDHGTDDPVSWPPRRLAACRHGELRRSLATLGVQEYHLLGFEDGTCDTRDGTDAIARHIVDIRPDVIVTFGPDGMTGHLDHRAVSRWTTDAWMATGSDAELWYTTVTPDFHQQWGARQRNGRVLVSGLRAAEHTARRTVPLDHAHEGPTRRKGCRVCEHTIRRHPRSKP